jgi:hypothetical protein
MASAAPPTFVSRPHAVSALQTNLRLMGFVGEERILADPSLFTHPDPVAFQQVSGFDQRKPLPLLNHAFYRSFTFCWECAILWERLAISEMCGRSSRRSKKPSSGGRSRPATKSSRQVPVKQLAFCADN